MYQLQFSANVTWTIATVCCKLALLRLYMHIFPLPTFVRVTWVVIAMTVLYAVVLIPIFFVACTPISASWDPLLHETHCWPWQYHSISAVSVNMFLDVVIVAMPLPVVWNIQMPMKKKIGVSAMFCVGLT
jgi:hypothetical protein